MTASVTPADDRSATRGRRTPGRRPRPRGAGGRPARARDRQGDRPRRRDDGRQRSSRSSSRSSSRACWAPTATARSPRCINLSVILFVPGAALQVAAAREGDARPARPRRRARGDARPLDPPHPDRARGRRGRVRRCARQPLARADQRRAGVGRGRGARQRGACGCCCACSAACCSRRAPTARSGSSIVLEAFGRLAVGDRVRRPRRSASPAPTWARSPRWPSTAIGARVAAAPPARRARRTARRRTRCARWRATPRSRSPRSRSSPRCRTST